MEVRTLTEEEMRERLRPLKRSLRPFQAAFLEGTLDWKGYVKATFGAATNSHAQYINHQLMVAFRGHKALTPLSGVVRMAIRKSLHGSRRQCGNDSGPA